MPSIEIYTRDFCPYCNLAKRLLKTKGLAWKEINLSRNPERSEEMLQRAKGRTTVPEIFIQGSLIGGWDHLSALERAGKLDLLLAS
ncbi:MAG: glutaredoxin 3 [Planctomycetota bacterium]